MHTWKVTSIERDYATVAYGPMTFSVEILHSDKGIIVLKPTSFFLDGPSHREMINLVKREYRRRFSD